MRVYFAVLETIGVGSDFDVDDLLDHECSNELQDHRACQHLLAHGIFKEEHTVLVVQLEHHSEENRWQAEQYDTGESTFAGQSLNLSPDLKSFPNEMADLVQDLGQITTRLSLQNDRRREEPQVQVRHSVGQSIQGFVHRNAQVLFLVAASELGRNRRLHFGGNQVKA